MEFCYRLFTKILSCLGLTFLTITLSTPFWMKITAPHFSFTMGLWRICVDKSCSKLVVYSVMFQVYRALMTTSVLIGLMAVATSFVPILRRYQLPVITNVSTGMLSLITMLLYSMWISMKLLRDGHGFPLDVSFSWSFTVGCLGCSMFIICGFLHILIEVQIISRIPPRKHVTLVIKPQDMTTRKHIERPEGTHSLV